MPYQPIENYGVIGNLQTVALVGMNGSIDFLSFPYFDSPTVFAALLDDKKGGRFSVTPAADGSRHKQLYLTDSNILLTRFLCPEGVVEVSDFMPISVCPSESGDGRNHPTQLVRRVKVVRGEMRCRMLCAPRFDYARSPHRVEQPSDKIMVFAEEGDGRLVLRLRSIDVPMRRRGGDAVAEFTLRAGESATFVLEEVRDHAESPLASHDGVVESFKDTMNYWRDWVARSTYKGRWRESVNRSALVLKLMTSQKYGSIVAAPTFGLPESIGHGRNWDYRFTWIRDASFTVYALNRLGYNEEAGAFMHWIEQRCAEMHPDKGLQIMYGIDGRHDLPEIELGQSRRLPRQPARAHRQRRVRPAPARHLRRVDGLGLPLRQVRPPHRLRRLAGRDQADRLRLQKLPSQATRASGRCAAASGSIFIHN